MNLATVQAGGGGIAGTIARVGLTALSAPYAVAVAVRGWLYDARVWRASRAGVPVVSIGNVTAGGTGKTPFVAWMAKRLLAAARAPGILSRGHGPRPRGALRSDEGVLLDELLGVSVPQVEDPCRVRGAARLLADHPSVDVLLLDDGFQHRRLARDVDVVLLDATNPFGFRRLLPRGLLRERPRALRRAHAVVLTRAERVDDAALARLRSEVAAIAPNALLAIARTRPRALLDLAGVERRTATLAGLPVGAWSGIGNPSAFEATLLDLGARVVWSRRSPDHHDPTVDETRDAVKRSRAAGAATLVVTRKDLVKLAALPRSDGLLADGIVALDVETDVVDGAEALLALVPTRGATPRS